MTETSLLMRRLSGAAVTAAALAAAVLGTLRVVPATPATETAAIALLALVALQWRRSRAQRRVAISVTTLSLAALSAAALVLAGGHLPGHAHRLNDLARAALGGVAHASTASVHVSAAVVLAADVLVAGALAAYLFTIRSAAAAPAARSDPARELAGAHELVRRHGEDSIAPFILRPDKAFAFAADGVLAYRVLGRTAVVSGDPVAPAGRRAAVLATFLAGARQRGLTVALYGAGAGELEAYRRLGLRALRVGEEAIVYPERFSLEGRAVRKLRQSVHRIQRRGWEITACDGAAVDAATEAELEALEAHWRAQHPRLVGFAMSMGAFEGGVAPGDLYLLARDPDGRLAGAMRFIAHRGKLSLDTMRRVGETPNGLNEALVCRALEVARERGVSEVSLNYAGLAHLVRGQAPGGPLRRRLTAVAMALLSRRFQMERLVRFNEKFSPEWRPRYLVYPSRRALPGAILRVLQAEGYIPHRARIARARGHGLALPAYRAAKPTAVAR